MSLNFSLPQVFTLFDWFLFLREQLNASLPGPQSQNQSATYSPLSNNASHLGPNLDGHDKWPSTYPMDVQTGQAQLLKHKRLSSHTGTEAWARLQPSPDLPTYLSNTSESRLHLYTDHNQPHPVPRSLAATALPYEHRTSYTTNALRQTSSSNLNIMGSHDVHQRTSGNHPLSKPPGSSSSFSIDESTVKHHDVYVHYDDDGYNRYFISHFLLTPVLNLIKRLLVSHS